MRQILADVAEFFARKNFRRAKLWKSISDAIEGTGQWASARQWLPLRPFYQWLRGKR